MGLREEIQQIAFASGEIDFFGVAPASRLSGAPEGSRPTDILPLTRSVISLGINLGLGMKMVNLIAYRSNPLAIYPYSSSQIIAGQVLEHNAYRVARYLEKRGYQAVGIPTAAPADRLRLHGVLSHRHAAVAAGVGQFGLNGLVVNKEAGSMIRLVTVLTEAEIEPNPVDSGPSICLEAKCSLCIDGCPMNAFDRKQRESVTLDGKEFFYNRFLEWHCAFGSYGMRKATLGRKDCAMPEDPRPADFVAAVAEQDPFQKLEGGGAKCGQCQTLCPLGPPLRKTGRKPRALKTD